MKNVIYLLLILLSFGINSCSKNSDNSESPYEFAGNWSGTYTGDESGTWSATISASGVVTGTAIESSTSYQSGLNGDVSSDGTFTATVGTTTQGYEFVGQLNGNSISGTWSNASSNHNGTWSGTKE
ncbi:MAG TPA: hypothetical protein PK335_08135 [Draconibacterium sp.]|nr:hypothetical protein [Draconibacterium sp.]